MTFLVNIAITLAVILLGIGATYVGGVILLTVAILAGLVVTIRIDPSNLGGRR